AEQFTMRDRAEAIACPTLVTMAENDPLAAGAETFFDALRGPKKALLRFTAAEGADGHCEMQNRSLLNRRVLDWLDETLVYPAALEGTAAILMVADPRRQATQAAARTTGMQVQVFNASTSQSLTGEREQTVGFLLSRTIS